jgi:hypothetical protein
MDLVPKILTSTDPFTCIKDLRGTRTIIAAAELGDLCSEMRVCRTVSIVDGTATTGRYRLTENRPPFLIRLIQGLAL